MASEPTTTDSTAPIVSQTVTDIFGAAVTAAETAIIAAQPWLGLPVIKQLWEALFSYIVGKISGALGTAAGFLVIDLQTYTEVTNAASAIQALQAAQTSGDSNAITQARAQADAAAAALLHYNGSV